MRKLIRCEAATIVFKSVGNLASEYLSHSFVINSDHNTISRRNVESDLVKTFHEN